MSNYMKYSNEVSRYKNDRGNYTIYYDNNLCKLKELQEIQIIDLLNKFNKSISYLPPTLLAEVDNLKDYLIRLRSAKLRLLKSNIVNSGTLR